MTGEPVLAASATLNVLLPDPAKPVTTMRRPTTSGDSLMTPVFLAGPLHGTRVTAWPERSRCGNPDHAATEPPDGPERHGADRPAVIAQDGAVSAGSGSSAVSDLSRISR